MRIVTVLGVIISGVAIGAAAVLAPLSIGAQSPSSPATGWMAGMNESAAGIVRSVVATLSAQPRDTIGETARSPAERGFSAPTVTGVRGVPVASSPKKRKVRDLSEWDGRWS